MSQLKRFGLIGVALVLAACTAPATQAPAATLAPLPTYTPAAPVVVTQLVTVEVTRIVAPTVAPTAVATDTPVVTTVPVASGPGVVGKPVTSGTIVFTVLAVTGAKSIQSFLTPKSGNVFVVCQVLIQNIGSTPASYNPYDYKLKDADGFEYTQAGAAPDPMLHSGDLAASDKVRGNIAFEVPQTAKALVLTYDLSLFNAENIQVSLGDAPTAP